LFDGCLKENFYVFIGHYIHDIYKMNGDISLVLEGYVETLPNDVSKELDKFLVKSSNLIFFLYALSFQ